MIKTGIDLVLNKRIEKNISSQGFLKKVFLPSELINKDKLVGIFSLKEAVMKCLEKKVDWKEITIEYKNSSKPKIILSDKIKPNNMVSIDSSISHNGDYTIGIVVMEFKN